MCKADVIAPPDNAAFPFCSARCQLADLARWLDGDYRVAGRDGEAAATLAPDAAERDHDGDERGQRQ
jgi:endogenous inhibitor of DNA gyrase (YacG/DUF329 family)